MKEEKDNVIAEKTFQFAIKIVKFQRWLCEEKREYILSKQILKSGTSIGANVREGIRAQSKADFISKMSISLKEASETLYWIDLLFASDYMTKEQYNNMRSDCRELIAILTAILKTAKDT